MKVHTLLEPGGAKQNEDQLLVEDALLAVFDGATSLDGYMDGDGNTGGFLASLTAKEEFSAGAGSLMERAIAANDALAEKMKTAEVDVTDKTNRWGTAVAAIQLTEVGFEWLTVADSIALAIYSDGSFAMIGEYRDHDLETIKLWQQHAEQKEENIREKVLDHIIANRRQANIDYGSLNGEPEFVDFVQYGSEDLENIAHILLFTDGLIMPTKSAEEEDWETIVKLYFEGGLESVRNEVRAREANDPQQWVYPRLKPSDDIGAIAIDFTK